MKESLLTGRLPIAWIVDDSPTEQLLTERSLGDGFIYRRFSDGADVIECVAAGGELPDVMLLDWVMPGMSGDEVCSFLRRLPATRDLPIIMVTASRIDTSDVVAGLALGANDYVARPFAPEELSARVKAVLRAKQLNDAATRERTRLAAVNVLGHKLFQAGGSIDRILTELAATLIDTICDGCAIALRPADLPPMSVIRHHRHSSAKELGMLASVSEPCVHGFASSAEALSTLPATYRPYIERFGLSALAILALPAREHVQGVITVTRDGRSSPFAPDDLATIETCIEYASLAVENALLLEAERAARTQLHAVFDHAPIGIVVTNPVGTVTLANPSAATLLPGIERSVGGAATFRLARWTGPDGAAIDEAEWMATRSPEPREPRSTEIVMHPLDGGSAHRLVVQTVPLTGAGGSVTTMHDVTAEREIAAERERIGKFQEQMLAIVGHDLRTPLGAVVMGADAVDAYVPYNDAAHKVTARIRRAALRMQGIIELLLDVTRARLGEGIRVELQDVALRPMVRGVLDELATAFPSARFELVGDDGIRGLWDPDRLAQVVSNLASNAMHYGRTDAPIVISVSSLGGIATVTVANEVRDQPIDPAKLATLFDPYQRGRDGTRNVQGLGLGLYIVSEIVRAHHGTIAATSTRAGTVFRVDLPHAPPCLARR